MTDAVSTVLYGTGRRRTENERWVLFRSHYGFDAFYCQPGIEGAHEKGGVEGDVGRFRRTHLSPMPVVDSLAELNEQIRVWDRADEHRRVGNRIRTVEQDYALDRAALAPLPAERFDPGLTLTPRVDRSSLVRVRMASYSVPARLVHRQVRVSLRASEVVVFDGRTEVARHPRVVTRHGQSVDLDRYLERAEDQARRTARVDRPRPSPGRGDVHPCPRGVLGCGAQDRRRRRRPRALIEVLLLHRSMHAADVVAGLEAALQVGAVTADVVAVEARRAAGVAESVTAADPAPITPASVERRVVSLTQRRLADPAAVAARLNSRPRKTLCWKTPAGALTELLASTSQGGVASTG